MLMGSLHSQVLHDLLHLLVFDSCGVSLHFLQNLFDAFSFQPTEPLHVLQVDFLENRGEFLLIVSFEFFQSECGEKDLCYEDESHIPPHALVFIVDHVPAVLNIVQVVVLGDAVGRDRGAEVLILDESGGDCLEHFM